VLSSHFPRIVVDWRNADVQYPRRWTKENRMAAKDKLEEKFEMLVETIGDPLEEIFRIGMDLDEEANIRLKALETAASYGYAKRKAIEHTISGDPNNPLKMEFGIDLKNLTDKDLNSLHDLIAKAQVDGE
jgi:hypothetical protein